MGAGRRGVPLHGRGNPRGSVAGSGVAAPLRELVATFVPCAFWFPTAPPDLEVDWSKLRAFVEPEPGTPFELPLVADATACTGGGFYLDDPAAPTDLILCPYSCGDLRPVPLHLDFDCGPPLPF